MKASVVLSAVGFATLAAAHGNVLQMIIDDKTYGGYLPYKDPYDSPHPQRIGWSFPGNGPVGDFTSKDIACGTNSQPGVLTAPAPAGCQVKFFWTEWPESHRGPTMTYLAPCTSGDCRKEDPSTLDWFKIDHAGLNADGTWASDTLIKNNSTRTVTIPKELKPGPYLIRHELLALHAAGQPKGAQFYPMCANLDITGTGTGVPDKTVKFPGAYKVDDKGILINIYYPQPTSYEIPGPELVKLVSSGSGDNGQDHTTSTVAPTPTPSAPVVTPPAVQNPYATTTDSPVAQTTVTPAPTPTPTPVNNPHSCQRRKAKRVMREELKKKNA